MKISNRIYLLLAAFTFITLTGCDSTNTEDEAPDVIPSEVFTLPVDLFNQTTAKNEMPGVNFTAAALRVWPVSLIISANLIIPSITTISALEADPVFQDGAWVWAASASSGTQTIGYSLSASRSGGETTWSMRITTTDPASGESLEDFELFSAQTSQDGAVGSWQLYYYLDGASANVLNASYTTGDTEKTITFSIPQSAAQGAGDSVEYRESGTSRSFVWEQVAEAITHDISWDATTSEGSISATNFNSGTMGCWDTSLEDAACSPS